MLNKKSNFLAGYFKDWKNILTFIFLIILGGLGVFLRIRNLGYLSFWGDDGHTVIGTLSIIKHGYPLLPSGYVLFHGILDYYLNVIPVLVFGATEFAFRVTSVFFGVSTIILIYFVGKEVSNKFVGFLSAFLITFSTWYIQFSREARYFAAFQFFFLLSFYFFYKGFIKDQRLFRILTIIFFILNPLIHDLGFILLLFFIILLFYKGRSFFRKQIIVPFLVIIFFDALQIINQVFFWKVGRSFFSSGKGIRAIIAAYFKLPDPYYFKILKVMFPGMFYIFLGGIAVFIALSIFLSVKKSYHFSDLYLNENEILTRRARFPFNMFMLYIVFTLIITIISFGQMYNQQRYIYFSMPLFVLIFSYVIFIACFSISKWINYGFIKIFKKSEKQVSSKKLNLIITVIFIAVSFLTLSGINLKEANAIPYIKHSDKLNTLYSISSSWSYHWDAAETGKHIAAYMQQDDIVITTDVYNSYPYTRRIDYWLWTGNLVSYQPYHEENGEVRDDTYGAVVIRDIFKFMDVFNDNYDKNIWVNLSYSMLYPEHIDPAFRGFFDKKKDNLVLMGRDNVSRLYFFPKSDKKNRVLITGFIEPVEDNTIIPDDDGRVFLDFTNDNTNKYLISGWGKVEKATGTWGLDGRSILFIDATDSSFDIAKESTLKITAHPLPHPELIQELSIYINGEQAYTLELDEKDNFKEYSVRLEPGLFKQGLNVIEFRYSYSFTPLELGLGSDGRNLAVLFKGIEISN